MYLRIFSSVFVFTGSRGVNLQSCHFGYSITLSQPPTHLYCWVWTAPLFHTTIMCGCLTSKIWDNYRNPTRETLQWDLSYRALPLDVAHLWVPPSVSLFLSQRLSICLYSMYIYMFPCLCSVPGKIIPLIHFLAVQTAVFPAHNSKPCLLFRVDLETKAKCLDSSSLSPPALSVSSFFCRTHIFHSLSP